MEANFFPYFFLVLVVSFSCRKDNCVLTVERNYSNDTVISSPYLAAYPGSWWKYDNGDHFFVEDYDLFEIVSKKDQNNQCSGLVSDRVYLPRHSLLGYIGGEF